MLLDFGLLWGRGGGGGLFLNILILDIYEVCIQNLSLPVCLESFKKFAVVGGGGWVVGGYNPEYSVRFGPRLGLKT